MKTTHRRSLRALLTAAALLLGIVATSSAASAHYCNGDPTDCAENDCPNPNEAHDHPCRTRLCEIAPAICAKGEAVRASLFEANSSLLP